MSSTAAKQTCACWCFFRRLDRSACGGASALEALLETQTDLHLRVFVIWEPVLATDLSAPSTIAIRRLHDPRVKQYWDRNRVLSHAMGEHDRPILVCTYIAVYKP